MQLRQLALITVLLSFSAPKFEEAQVLRATEAETIIVIIRGTPQTVRYIGVEPPPPWDPIQGRDRWAEAAGGLARDELVGRTIYLEYGKQQYDSNGQIWAYIWTEQPDMIDDDTVRALMFNAHLILKGYAALKAEQPNTHYAALFAEYQREAQAANRGIWSQMEPSVAPLED